MKQPLALAMVPTTTAASDGSERDSRVARLQEELARRDEIVVALQHVIRDLRHENENLRTEHVYVAFARGAPSSDRAGLCGQAPPVHMPGVGEESAGGAGKASGFV
jgi:hypothetical protein